MECCVSVRFRVRHVLFFVITVMSGEAALAETAVVLVTSRDSPIAEMSSLDIRKAYMGISVTVNAFSVRAVRRRDDDRLNKIFLQSVIAMSQRSYERRLLSLVLKFGTPRPAEARNREELAEWLEQDPSSITYMWKSDAEADPSVRIIGILWQET
jgi:hypothetical protein